MSIVKINWSGGKDSTASVLLHLEQGDICKVVFYVPMLTNEIPLISKVHYNFIMRTAKWFKSQGCKVYRAKGTTYWEHVHTQITRGKNKGKYKGYALGFGYCEFRRDSKVKALNSLKLKYDYQDIGIAADEVKRHSQLNTTLRSILVEKGYTEQDAFKLCKDKGLLSPHYDVSKRDGCVICPYTKPKEWPEWLNDFPEGEEILRQIDEFCKTANIKPQKLPHYGQRNFSQTITELRQEGDKC